ncbi:MAG: 2-oxoglutarate dehydrogenase, component, dihydrolipoamide succinyltransferase [Bryobacterales bacterium]|nr:2-oxoglutarate dehydrogenase, component, dihydrolipoamide succinyltransferase [Bryobacterales bacterium]
MPTEIVMPQMGESIVEGTITKWLKKPGDKIQRDEPLFEISTDKVDAEIPAPASGVLQEIKVAEGATVQVNTVVGTISSDGEAPTAAKTAPAPEKKAASSPAPSAPKVESRPAARTEPAPAPPAQVHEEDEHARSSPLVRKMAREHNVNLSQVEGSGLGGRITKQDILSFIEGQSGAAVQESGATGVSPVQQRTGAPSLSSPGLARQGGDISQPSAPTPAPRPSPAAIPGDLVPMTNMRKIIAQRMIESRRTSAHVHCMFEVDMTRIVNLRNKLKSSFEQRNGARLTFMPFFVRAAILGLQQFPIVNASLEGDGIRYHRHVNVGIAVALDWGLIVPVLKNADELNFLGLQRGITDLGERARNKKLKPEEVEGSTFTVTNPGQFGAVFGLPIINQPNSAIMGVGGITKMPLVVTDKDGADSIAIRSVVHLTLGYDHRIIDGAVADQFMAFVKKTLEGWSEDVG